MRIDVVMRAPPTGKFVCFIDKPRLGASSSRILLAEALRDAGRSLIPHHRALDGVLSPISRPQSGSNSCFKPAKQARYCQGRTMLVARHWDRFVSVRKSSGRSAVSTCSRTPPPKLAGCAGGRVVLSIVAIGGLAEPPSGERATSMPSAGILLASGRLFSRRQCEPTSALRIANGYFGLNVGTQHDTILVAKRTP